MILIVSGGRDITDVVAFGEALAQVEEFIAGTSPLSSYRCNWTHVFVGDACGVDEMVRERCAWTNSLLIYGPDVLPCHVFAADWNQHGRSAGPLRNREMIDAAVVFSQQHQTPVFFLALWDGKSRGTASAINLAMERVELDGARFVFRYLGAGRVTMMARTEVEGCL